MNRDWVSAPERIPMEHVFQVYHRINLVKRKNLSNYFLFLRRRRIALSDWNLCFLSKEDVPLDRASLVFGSIVIMINSRMVWGTDLGESAPTVSLMPGGARRQRINLIGK